jgi:hypothetical protein
MEIKAATVNGIRAVAKRALSQSKEMTEYLISTNRQMSTVKEIKAELDQTAGQLSEIYDRVRKYVSAKGISKLNKALDAALADVVLAASRVDILRNVVSGIVGEKPRAARKFKGEGEEEPKKKETSEDVADVSAEDILKELRVQVGDEPAPAPAPAPVPTDDEGDDEEDDDEVEFEGASVDLDDVEDAIDDSLEDLEAFVKKPAVKAKKASRAELARRTMKATKYKIVDSGFQDSGLFDFLRKR